MDLRRGLTPAILSYEGIQYRYMAPDVFTDAQFDYLQEHLRILSGFYGLLRPFDGVTPYRLEMQAKLSVDGAKDLYAFWGADLASALAQDAGWVLDLASKEYSDAVAKHLPPSVRLVRCVFGEEQEGRVVERALCARWPGARWCAIWPRSAPNARRTFLPSTGWATASRLSTRRKMFSCSCEMDEADSKALPGSRERFLPFGTRRKKLAFFAPFPYNKLRPAIRRHHAKPRRTQWNEPLP